MNRNSVYARVVPGMLNRLFDDQDDYLPQPGDIDISLDGHGFHLACPGCGITSTLVLAPPMKGQQHWQLSGSPMFPTLTPQINHKGCWHGFLTDGKFESI